MSIELRKYYIEGGQLTEVTLDSCSIIHRDITGDIFKTERIQDLEYWSSYLYEFFIKIGKINIRIPFKFEEEYKLSLSRRSVPGTNRGILHEERIYNGNHVVYFEEGEKYRISSLSGFPVIKINNKIEINDDNIKFYDIGGENSEYGFGPSIQFELEFDKIKDQVVNTILTAYESQGSKV